MQLLSHGAKCNMANIFLVSHILLIIAKYEKRGKYQPILHGKLCDNYIIVLLSLCFVMTTCSLEIQQLSGKNQYLTRSKETQFFYYSFFLGRITGINYSSAFFRIVYRCSVTQLTAFPQYVFLPCKAIYFVWLFV